MFQKKYLIGQELVRRGLITQDNLDFALIEHESKNLQIGQILVRNGFVKEDAFLEVLSEQLDLPLFKVSENEIEKEVLNLLDGKVVREFRCLPVKREGDKILICVTNKLSPKEIDKLSVILKEPIAFVLDSDRNVLTAIKKYYGLTDEEDLEFLEE